MSTHPPTETLTVREDGPLPDTGDFIVQIDTPDGRTFGPGGITDGWKVMSAYHPMHAPSYARPRHGDVRLNYFDQSFTDVPLGTTLTLVRAGAA